jgi:hypothetical protein
MWDMIQGWKPAGPGHYQVLIHHRGELIRGVTSNMPDFDLFRSGKRGFKAAGNRIYKEIKGTK